MGNWSRRELVLRLLNGKSGLMLVLLVLLEHHLLLLVVVVL